MASFSWAIEIEGKLKKSDVVTYNEIWSDIMDKMMALHNCPKHMEGPFIYHLDVGGMYTNIILTNRHQPSANQNSPFIFSLYIH